MINKLLMVSSVAIAGLVTACGLKALGGATVSAVPQTFPKTAPFPVQASRPTALLNPALIQPQLPLGKNIGGRPDPFSALPLTPIVTIKQNPAPSGLALGAPLTAPSVIQTLPTQTAATAQESTPLPSVVVPATVLPIAAAASQPPAQAMPQATPQAVAAAPVAPILMAQAIAVSGIVQAGSKTSIIVQVPHEMSSRSAVVGDYLANGKVLVKRIEMQGAEPVVVLEQDGAEFIKPVGSGSLGSL
jgi:hypothetical protein